MICGRSESISKQVLSVEIPSFTPCIPMALSPTRRCVAAGCNNSSARPLPLVLEDASQKEKKDASNSEKKQQDSLSLSVHVARLKIKCPWCRRAVLLGLQH